jgi:hypothetical protein
MAQGFAKFPDELRLINAHMHYGVSSPLRGVAGGG